LNIVAADDIAVHISNIVVRESNFKHTSNFCLLLQQRMKRLWNISAIH
jgi:3-dehydroquinate dehydratase